MKRLLTILCTIFLVTITLCCCGKVTPKQTKIVFPCNEFEKNENNKEIFEIDPFTLNITFPKNWKVVYPQNEKEAKSGFSTVCVYDGEFFIATIDYNIFQIYEDTTEENYRSIYNQLMLSSMVNWDNNYQPVKKDEKSCSAVCEVLVNLPNGEFTFPGILAYNKDLLRYIVISFEKAEIEISDETLKNIANSINITKDTSSQP